MKTIIFPMVLLLLFQYHVHAQSMEAYQKKAEYYKGLKTTGIVMLVSGVVLTGVGIALLSSAEWKQERNSSGTSTTSDDDEALIGGMLTAIGIPLAISGTVLAMISGTKQAQSKKMMEAFSLQFRYAPRQQSMALVYRF